MKKYIYKGPIVNGGPATLSPTDEKIAELDTTEMFQLQLRGGIIVYIDDDAAYSESDIPDIRMDYITGMIAARKDIKQKESTSSRPSDLPELPSRPIDLPELPSRSSDPPKSKSSKTIEPDTSVYYLDNGQPWINPILDIWHKNAYLNNGATDTWGIKVHASSVEGMHKVSALYKVDNPLTIIFVGPKQTLQDNQDKLRNAIHNFKSHFLKHDGTRTIFNSFMTNIKDNMTKIKKGGRTRRHIKYSRKTRRNIK